MPKSIAERRITRSNVLPFAPHRQPPRRAWECPARRRSWHTRPLPVPVALAVMFAVAAALWSVLFVIGRGLAS